MTASEALECHAIGQRYQRQGQHSEALAQFAQAAEYFAASQPNLANLLSDQAESLLELCRYHDAEQTARRATEILESMQMQLDAPTRGALLSRAYGLWGRALRDLGRYKDAEAPLLAAVQEAPLQSLPAHLNNYGVLCKYSGEFEAAERSYLRALTLLEQEFGKQSQETATVYHNLGGLEHARGNFAKGEPLARMAYEIRRNSLGDDHEATLADAVAWGGVLDGLERYSDSVPIYRRALKLYEARFGPEHFEVAATLNNLGMARAAQGDRKEARALLMRCIEIKVKLFGESHPEVLLTRRNLSAIEEAAPSKAP